jgi:hypothetical protein
MKAEKVYLMGREAVSLIDIVPADTSRRWPPPEMRKQQLWDLITQWGDGKNWPADTALVHALKTGDFDYGTRDAFRRVTVDRLNWPAPKKSSNRNDIGYKAVGDFIEALKRVRGVDALVVEHRAKAERAKKAAEMPARPSLSAAQAKKGV